MEGQGSSKQKLFANVAESSRQVTPAGSAHHRLSILVGDLCLVWHLFLRWSGGEGVLRFITQAGPKRLLVEAPWHVSPPPNPGRERWVQGIRKPREHHLYVTSSHPYAFLIGAQFIISPLPSCPWWNSKLTSKVSFISRFCTQM